jgi:hypothetical protein
MRDTSASWAALLVLGAAHGLNPAMGWLFAVGRGLQKRDRRELWLAFGPLALGHALAIVVAISVALVLGRVLPLGWLRWIVVAALVLVGADGLVRHRHVRLGGMRVNAGELTAWSFLMASAHGAGLMVLPVVLGGSAAPVSVSHHHHAAAAIGSVASAPLAAGLGGLDAVALSAALVHTAGYLAVTCFLAVVVYEKVGLGILRRAWINVNVVWSASMLVAAVLAALG